MNESLGLKKRLANLEEERAEYEYNHSESLNKKMVIPMMGATAVGKSTLVQRMLELAQASGIDAAEVGSDMTRQHRPGDPSNYTTGIPHELMLERIEQHELVNWSAVTNAKTGDFDLYGTRPEGFPAEYNFMPCLPESVPMLQTAGFAAVRVFYIATTVDAWKKQLQERKGKPDFGRRMDEAMISLPIGLKTERINKIVSLPGNEELTKTAQLILDRSKSAHFIVYGGFKVTEYIDPNFEGCCKAMFNAALELAQEFESNEPVKSA